MKKKILIGASIIIITYIITQYFQTIQKPYESAFVVRVIDGDTIELQNGDKVRLLGINAPEKKEFYYEESTEELTMLVDNREIKMERDVINKDKYGRLLRYIYVDNKPVNLILLRGGYAELDIEYKLEHEKEFRDAEDFAKDKKWGIWSK